LRAISDLDLGIRIANPAPRPVDNDWTSFTGWTEDEDEDEDKDENENEDEGEDEDEPREDELWSSAAGGDRERSGDWAWFADIGGDKERC